MLQSNPSQTPDSCDCWERQGPVWGWAPADCSSRHPPPPPEDLPGSRQSHRCWPCWHWTSAAGRAVLVAVLAAGMLAPPQSGVLMLGVGFLSEQVGAWLQCRSSSVVSDLAGTSSCTACAPVGSRLSLVGKAVETQSRRVRQRLAVNHTLQHISKSTEQMQVTGNFNAFLMNCCWLAVITTKVEYHKDFVGTLRLACTTFQPMSAHLFPYCSPEGQPTCCSKVPLIDRCQHTANVSVR